jgi:diamine N-acetyltransferase
MIRYRTPTIDDAQALARLGRDTFVEAFAYLYKPEDLEPFLAQTYAPETVSAQLGSPDYLFRVAEADGTLIGYCKLGQDNGFPGDFAGRKVMEFKQLYLRDGHKGAGIADALMDWALSEARARGFDDLVLSVFSGNPRAIRFYERHGFAFYKNWYFMVGNHRDDEYLYRLKITP